MDLLVLLFFNDRRLGRHATDYSLSLAIFQLGELRHVLFLLLLVLLFFNESPRVTIAQLLLVLLFFNWLRLVRELGREAS